MVNDFACIIMIPVVIKDPPLFKKVTISFGVRERCEYCKFCKIKVNFKKKIYQTFDIIFCLIIKAKQDRSFYTDPMIVVLPYPVTDIIGTVKNCLVDIPCASLCCEIQYIIFILNGMA